MKSCKKKSLISRLFLPYFCKVSLSYRNPKISTDIPRADLKSKTVSSKHWAYCCRKTEGNTIREERKVCWPWFSFWTVNSPKPNRAQNQGCLWFSASRRTQKLFFVKNLNICVRRVDKFYYITWTNSDSLALKLKTPKAKIFFPTL